MLICIWCKTECTKNMQSLSDANFWLQLSNRWLKYFTGDRGISRWPLYPYFSVGNKCWKASSFQCLSLKIDIGVLLSPGATDTTSSLSTSSGISRILKIKELSNFHWKQFYISPNNSLLPVLNILLRNQHQPILHFRFLWNQPIL